MAIFGLSPLFLSLIASSNFFTDPDTGLNVTHFLRFHAIISGCIHLIGAVFLKLPPAPDVDLQRFLTDDPQRDTDLEPDERTVLLPGKPPNEIGTQVVAVDGEGQSALDLARDPNFWILFVVSLIILGCVNHFWISINPYTDINAISAKWCYQTLEQSCYPSPQLQPIPIPNP